ncbi:hypothetical protein ACFFLM_04065 [Deinococcus oregonensis]|uniref:Lipocalin-like domain-containing protein n=1 Tax=Deinococcus oregonensis TaxID=1805970 RepID=A0ABV6AWT2_9DEIO
MKRIFLLTALALTLAACGGGTPTPIPAPAPSSNQQQTERLYGSWNFNYSIINNYTSSYQLKTLQKSNGTEDYYLAGTNEYGGVVVAGFHPSTQRFSLLDPGSSADFFYTFDFTGSNTVTGCFYLVVNDELSDCYSMNGNRYSLNTSALTNKSMVAALANEQTKRATVQLGSNPAVYQQYLDLRKQLK